jgi:hypothetical protein
MGAVGAQPWRNIQPSQQRPVLGRVAIGIGHGRLPSTRHDRPAKPATPFSRIKE